MPNIWKFENYEEYVIAQNKGYQQKVNSHVGVVQLCFLERVRNTR